MQILQNISQKSSLQSLCAWIYCKTFPNSSIFLLHILCILIYNRNDFPKLFYSLPFAYVQGFFNYLTIVHRLENSLFRIVFQARPVCLLQTVARRLYLGCVLCSLMYRYVEVQAKAGLQSDI